MDIESEQSSQARLNAGKNVSVTLAVEADLIHLNAVITRAVMAWPLPERLKRLSLSSMQYDEQDLQHFEIFVARDNAVAKNAVAKNTLAPDRLVGVASWDPDHEAALFHGLYIDPEYQRRGLGQRLMQQVFKRAKARGRISMLIRAERVSAGYFEQGEFEVVDTKMADYPYQFRKWL